MVKIKINTLYLFELSHPDNNNVLLQAFLSPNQPFL